MEKAKDEKVDQNEIFVSININMPSSSFNF